MPKSKKDPYRARQCKYCKGRFVPTTKNSARADEQQFCSAAHRKEFWRSGTLPFEKLMQRVEKRCREIVREEIEAAVAERFETAYCPTIEGPNGYDGRAVFVPSESAKLEDLEKSVRIHKRLTGKGPIGREAAQALVDSFSPSRVRTEPSPAVRSDSPRSS
jgi:hypothetical protein